MFPDSLNILGIFSLVFLSVVCIRLTFIAWFDGQNGDLFAMKRHLRIIGIAQVAMLWTAVSIGTDMVAACRVDSKEAAETESAATQIQFVSQAVVNR